MIILLILATGFSTGTDPVTIHHPDDYIFLEIRPEGSEAVEFFTAFVETRFEMVSSITQSDHQLLLQEGKSVLHPLHKMFIALHTIRR
jgi:hypothetical protein